MIDFQNISYDEYIRKFADRKIVLIGAGGTFRSFLQLHRDKYFLLRNVDYVLDNNKEIKGQEVQLLDKRLQVDYLPDFCPKHSLKQYVVFILVSDESVCDVASQLDEITFFDEIPCIYGIGTFRWGYSFFSGPKYRLDADIVGKGKEKIPRIIHYCWFGDNEIPDKDKQCIDSQKKYHPDYQIIKWSEKNFDISKAPRYVRDAYSKKKYAFVSDYVRIYALYKYGGIYLDTDVELFGNLDFVLSYRMMFAYMEYGELATGLGFASVSGAAELEDMLEMYENIPFILDDGSLNLTPCPRYTNDYFRRKGLYLDNALEVKDDILFLSSDYLCPLNPVECSDGSYHLAQLALTDRTIGIHWCNNSWKDPKENTAFDREKQQRARINTRLLQDWLRKRKLEI